MHTSNRVFASLLGVALVVTASGAFAEPADGGTPAEELFLGGPGGTNVDPDAGGLVGPGLTIESTGLEGGGNDSGCKQGGGFCHCNLGRPAGSDESILAALGLALALVLRRR